MPIFYKDVEQRSAEWYRLRMSIVTASEIEKIITPGGKPSKSCQNYMNGKLASWVLGYPIDEEVEPYESKWMVHGRENEEGAVKAFEFQQGMDTEEIGFVTSDDGMVGCSPDRMVCLTPAGALAEPPYAGTLEIKCPAPQTQIGYLIGSSVADEYRLQVSTQMWVLGLDRAWVSSYHPKLPAVILEIGRDEKLIAQIAAAVGAFNEVMLQRREELETKFGPFVRPEQPATKEWGEEFHVSEADLAARAAAYVKELQS